MTIRVCRTWGSDMKVIHEKSDVVPLVAEVFREFGYEGTSMARITERTGLGKGSLYHFFPGGKEQMGADVLAHVDAWFVANVFEPLEAGEPRVGIEQMATAVDEYFQSGGRICLVGAFALDETRDRFGERIRMYFVRWIDALSGALVRAGRDDATARDLAEDYVVGVQGALVLARATGDVAVFARSTQRLMAAFDGP